MNLRLSGAFLPLISILEVALRNRIDGLFEDRYPNNDKNWLEILHKNIEQEIKVGNLRGAEFGQLKKQLNDAISGVEKKIEPNIINYLKRFYRKNNKEFKNKSKEAQEEILRKDTQYIRENKGYKIKKGVMIAQSNFALWTLFFDPEPYRYLNENSIHLIHIFNLKIAGNDENNRKKIADKLYDIRQFRNRIAHHESIIFKKQKFDSKYPEQIRNDILSILRLLNEDLSNYSEDIYRINKDIQKIEDYCIAINRIVNN